MTADRLALDDAAGGLLDGKVVLMQLSLALCSTLNPFLNAAQLQLSPKDVE